MLRRTLVTICTLLIAGVSLPAMADTLIDFDHDAFGGTISTGAEITSLYSSLGLSFGTVASGTYGDPGTAYEGDTILPGGYVGNSSHENHYVSPVNVVSFRTSKARNWRVFQDDWAYGYVDFLNPGVVRASIVASLNLPSDGHNAYVVARFDDSSSITELMTDGLLRQELFVVAPAGLNITRLEYHGQGFGGTPTGVYFDNLRYDTPEPGGLLLMGTGLVAIGFVARRRKTS